MCALDVVLEPGLCVPWCELALTACLYVYVCVYLYVFCLLGMSFWNQGCVCHCVSLHLLPVCMYMCVYLYVFCLRVSFVCRFGIRVLCAIV